DPFVLTIGAMNDKKTVDRSDDVMTTYSGRGPTYGDHVLKPDLLAPGNRIISCLAPGATLATLYPDRVVGKDRIELSGSSMAAGVVSGAVALLLERSPSLTPDQVKAILLYSADRMPGADRFEVGAGYLNLLHATAMSAPFRSVRFNSASPVVRRNPNG